MLCFQDIKNAEANNYPKNLKEKLLNRKNKTEKLKLNQEIIFYHDELPEIADKNSFVECAKNCLEIKNSEEYGRHVVANRRISIGEIIAIERPFTKILLNDYCYTHCYNCLKFTYNLTPCKTCVRIGFCSEECYEELWKLYHKYECSIIDNLREGNFHKLLLIALKIAVISKNFKSSPNENILYKSQNYEEIYNLITNHDLRKPTDLFNRCILVAMIYHFMKTYTNYFETIEEEERFRTSLLRHYEAASSNFHEISELVVGKECGSQEIGSGAYAFLSLLNHSCSPNVVRHCYGETIVLRALKPIENGEQLLDNYG